MKQPLTIAVEVEYLADPANYDGKTGDDLRRVVEAEVLGDPLSILEAMLDLADQQYTVEVKFA